MALLLLRKSQTRKTPIPAFPPSCDEMMEMLKHVPCFIDDERPSSKMPDFFPLTKQISMNLGGDPPYFFSARLPFVMPKSAVACIQQL